MRNARQNSIKMHAMLSVPVLRNNVGDEMK